VKTLSEEILEAVKADIAEAEIQLKTADELIKKLRQAGENTAELERKYRVAEARLRRFKVAFK